MATDLIERIYKLTVDGNAAERQLRNIAASTKSLDDAFAKVGGSIKQFAVGLAGAFTAGAIVSGIGRVIDSMDEAYKSSQKLGLSVESFTAWNYALSLSGVPAEAFATAVSKVSSAMGDLAGGKVNDATNALKRFGVTSKDTTDQALNKLVAGFSRLEDGPRKTALAIDIFGRAGQNLIPLLNSGTAGIEALKKEAERLGYVLSTETAKKAEQFNDNITRLQTAAKGLGLQITEQLLPPLLRLSEQLVENAKDFGLVHGAALTFFERMFGTGFERTMERYNEKLLERKQLEEQIARQGSETKVDRQRLDNLNKEIALLAQQKQLIEDLQKGKAAADAQNAKARTPTQVDTKAFEEAEKRAALAKREADARKKQQEGVEAEHARMVVEGNKAIERSIGELDSAMLANLQTWAEANALQIANIKTLDDEWEAVNKVEAAYAAWNEQNERTAQTLQVLNDWLRSGTEEQQKFARAQLEAMGALDRVTASVTKQSDELRIAERGAEQFFDNLSTGVADFEDVFRRTVQSVIAELLKLWAKKYIVDFIIGAFGGGPTVGPGAGGSRQELQTMGPSAGAQGASAMRASAMSLSANASMLAPLARPDGGSEGRAKVEVNVVNNAGAHVDARVDEQGRVEVLVERTRAALANDVRTGGTVFARAVESTYALGRARAG